jgi:hypothetical protein
MSTPALARPASEVTAQPVTWLWPGRLALGKLALLDGDPDRGKSLVSLDLCARLSTGRPWPDGTPSPGPQSSVIINAEDGEDDTICPRLRALGADLGRVFFLPRDAARGGADFCLPARTEALDRVLAETAARLVVIDPITLFLAAGVNTHSDGGGVRRALAPLVALAGKHGCTGLLVRHLNKGGRHQALYRGLGSIGLVGSCRSAWLVAADPRIKGRRVFAQEKNNVGPSQPSLAFDVVDAGGGLPAVNWLGTTDWGADALLAAAADRPAMPGPIDFAKEFLAEVLKDGPRTSREIWEKAEPLGHSQRTLDRAREALKIRTRRVHRDGQKTSWWLLPKQELPAHVATDPEDDIDESLRRLAELYPPATPLDDL